MCKEEYFLRLTTWKVSNDERMRRMHALIDFSFRELIRWAYHTPNNASGVEDLDIRADESIDLSGRADRRCRTYKVAIK